MITDEEAARTADRLGDALSAAAAVMTVSEITAPARESHAKRTRTWLIPLTAAACVAAVIIGSVAVARHPSGIVPASGTAIRTTQPPQYFVTNGDLPRTLAVRRTSDGAIAATLPLGSMDINSTISATADNRTFIFVDNGPGSSCSGMFYRFSITAKGLPQNLRPVGPVRGIVDNFAVSPDGSRIAFNVVGGGSSCSTGVASRTIMVLDVASGRVRSWHNSDTAATPARVLFIFGPMSWSGNRTLDVDYQWADGNMPRYLAVLGLDTYSAGGSVQAHSRVLFSQGASCSMCVDEVLAGPDSSSLMAVALQPAAPYRQWVLRISTATGRPDGVLYTSLREPQQGIEDFPALFADGTGQYLALFSKPQTGWISYGKVVPLRGTGRQPALVMFAW